MIVTLEHFSNGLGFFWMLKLENDGEMCKLWKIAKGKSKWKYQSFDTIFICWFFSHLGWIFEKNFEKYISLNSGLDKRVYAYTCLVMETADEEECCW